MEKKNFEDIKYDYIDNSSYLKIILDSLSEKTISSQQKEFMMELYYCYYRHFNEERKMEMSVITQMFKEKVASMDIEALAEYLYVNFIHTIIFDLSKREDAFNKLHNSVIRFVGYNPTYQANNQFNLCSRSI